MSTWTTPILSLIALMVMMNKMSDSIENIAHKLSLHLKSNPNVQTIGIRRNNVECYQQNPAWFKEEITEDSLIVYTFKKPSMKEQELNSFCGIKVVWRKLGSIRL
jgi:hypothetical protein